MAKIVVFESVTLDGVAQSPSTAHEDPRGGFTRGGWAAPYADAVTMGLAAEGMATTGALLFGRRTYEAFHAYWPNQRDNPFTKILDDMRKYVVSTTLPAPLAWKNSVLLRSEDDVAALRDRPGKDMVVLGSCALVDALARRGLVDRYVLLVHPVVLGAGRRLFADDLPPAKLRLVGTRTSTTGVVIATYDGSER